MPEEIDRAMDVLLGRMENEKHPVVSADFLQLTVRPTQGGEYNLEVYMTPDGLAIESEEQELTCIVNNGVGAKGTLLIPLDSKADKPTTEVNDEHIQ